MTGARTVVVGVDGLDFDVVKKLQTDLPHLARLIERSSPHASTFPPDSVPSWTSIVSGMPPEEHGQLHSVNFFIEDQGEVAGLREHEHSCFWEHARSNRIAVLNPFLAYPPWPPRGGGAMVSGPSFSEGPPIVADPNGLLHGDPPKRMGGFSRIPRQRDIGEFADETMKIADAQFAYALRQLEKRRWDLLFHTNLTVDRIQHFAWRHFDSSDPTHPGDALAHLVPAAYAQLDRFLGAVESTLQPDDAIVVVSDHGHGQRASIGVNFNELLRREGLFLLAEKSLVRRSVETVKTLGLWGAAACHLEEPAIWVARRLPGKAALKSGDVAGKPRPNSVRVPDVGGSNPFGGVRVDDPATRERVTAVLSELTYNGTRVLRWIRPAEEVLHSGEDPQGVYPELLFEMDPRFGPTWNMYGPVFMPIVTHSRLSGGHTRRGVAASSLPHMPARDSVDVHQMLVDSVGRE
jgi:hypothetical protein